MNTQTTRKDWVSDQEVRWCPGCGDYSVLMAMQMMLVTAGATPENTVFVSGIGCSSRFPYYMNTYGVHSIHGRAPAFATGLAISRPDLDVWVITGDGDALSIGGNHFIHALRRNINIKILLFNNQIYGLTKGQYSPTTEIGHITKSSPYGSLDAPFNPVSLALGAQGSFVARTHDMDRQHMIDMFKRAWLHKGAAMVEIYQNCNIYNDGAFEKITAKDARADNLIPLEHKKPIIFGKEKELGVILDAADGNVTGGPSVNLRIAKVQDVGQDKILVHDETREDSSLAFALSRLSRGVFEPTPIGVFRDVSTPEYGAQVADQLDGVKAKKGTGTLKQLLRSGPTWTVD
ncbi:MAG: 2-oxoacid:ferredoxin oxidoreductase subunit beta [Actinobacteria bacterium]|jgi:2-oxoglutarate ferredoxin oxidoreductase subunit beta|nr:2-oxoacid:ferredoxin oxidoreductase subunit beta [Actinomycetota bacterium]MCL6105401.1 2-oxoacid:ferredoxin oxidoreductase subunit beta [Actinomycetota bacterium]